MFLETLTEYAPEATARRRWAAFISYACELIAVGVLVLIPLFSTDALPKLQPLDRLNPPVEGGHGGHGGQRPTVKLVPVPPELKPGQLQEPREVPREVVIGSDQQQTSAAEADSEGNGVGTGTGGGNRSGDGLPYGIPMGPGRINPLIASVITAIPTIAKPARVSEGVAEGLLIRRVQPLYPAPARAARIQGEVVLTAIIARDGSIANLHAVRGHPMLIAAAVDAVRQWRYRPYLLNRQPVEVETQITISFKLNRD